MPSKKLQMGLELEFRVLGLLRAISGLHVTHRPAEPGARRGLRGAGLDLGELQAHDIEGRFRDQVFDIQVKGKGSPTFTRMYQAYEHGIDLPVWGEYVRLYEGTGIRLWLLIYELAVAAEGPGTIPRLLGQWWHKLPPPRIDKSARSHAPLGMVYWKRECFVPLWDTSFDPEQSIMRQDKSSALCELLEEFRNPPPTMQRRFL